MDEEISIRLTPEGFSAVEDGTADLNEEELFIARILQSYEAMDLGGAPEEDVFEIFRWYEQAMADQTLISMIQKGLLYVFLNEDGEVSYKATPLGREMTNEYARVHGFPVPDSDDLPTLD